MLENEAILMGHEGGVNSCKSSTQVTEGLAWEDVRLVSSSTDHSLIVWAPGTNVWSSRLLHLGDLTGSASVGADRSFGFYSGILTANLIVAHSSKGSQGCSWDREGRFILEVLSDHIFYLGSALTKLYKIIVTAGLDHYVYYGQLLIFALL